MILTEDKVLKAFSFFLEEKYHVEKLTESNIEWIFENEFAPELFDLYLNENYHVDQLTEEDIEFIFENDFVSVLEEAKKDEDEDEDEDEKDEDEEEDEKPKKKKEKEKEDMKESHSPMIAATLYLLEKKGNRKHAPKLDAVGKEDEDVNNDGKKDNSDEYLMKRRKAIAMKMKHKKHMKEEKEDPADKDAYMRKKLEYDRKRAEKANEEGDEEKKEYARKKMKFDKERLEKARSKKK
jgi:hypothetical protein